MLALLFALVSFGMEPQFLHDYDDFDLERQERFFGNWGNMDWFHDFIGKMKNKEVCKGKKCGTQCNTYCPHGKVCASVMGRCSKDLVCSNNPGECPQPKPVCCQANTATCQACKAGMEKEAYCKKMAPFFILIPGCEQEKKGADMCPGSPPQFCKMRCEPKECPTGQCLMRSGTCCDTTCQAPGGGGGYTAIQQKGCHGGNGVMIDSRVDDGEISLAACKSACDASTNCVSIDYFATTRWCTTYSKSCTDFPSSHDNPTHYLKAPNTSDSGGGNIVCSGQPAQNYCDCEGDCTGNPSWCQCDEAKKCCEGAQKVVLCAGQPKSDYCDCQGDCSQNTKFCSCSEAKADSCCGGGGDDDGDSGHYKGCKTYGKPNEWCVRGAPHFDSEGMVCAKDNTAAEAKCRTIQGVGFVCIQDNCYDMPVTIGG